MCRYHPLGHGVVEGCDSAGLTAGPDDLKEIFSNLNNSMFLLHFKISSKFFTSEYQSPSLSGKCITLEFHCSTISRDFFLSIFRGRKYLTRH